MILEEQKSEPLNPNFSLHAGSMRCGNRVLGTGAVIVGSPTPITRLGSHREPRLMTFQRAVNASDH